MAPRSLHFGKDRMFSEYNEKRVNEYLPWGLPFTGMSFITIAKRFGRVMPGPYTAGIFLSSNQSGFLWNNAYGAKYSRRNEGSWWKKIELDNKRDSVYRAPSW
jgi:hypothetical protein